MDQPRRPNVDGSARRGAVGGLPVRRASARHRGGMGAHHGESRSSVHRSVDGRRWEMPAGIGLSSVACCLEAGVDPSGTRLIGDHLGLLATSHDGVSWREIEIPYTPATPGGNSLGRDWLQAIVAPIASAPAWVLVTSRMDGTPATTWISQDLVTWATGKFPMAEVQHMARTRFGIVATGRDACGDGRCAIRAGPVPEPRRGHVGTNRIVRQRPPNRGRACWRDCHRTQRRRHARPHGVAAG